MTRPTAELPRSSGSGGAKVVQAVTVIIGVVVGLTFTFGFGNVLNLALQAPRCDHQGRPTTTTSPTRDGSRGLRCEVTRSPPRSPHEWRIAPVQGAATGVQEAGSDALMTTSGAGADRNESIRSMAVGSVIPASAAWWAAWSRVATKVPSTTTTGPVQRRRESRCVRHRTWPISGRKRRMMREIVASHL